MKYVTMIKPRYGTTTYREGKTYEVEDDLAAEFIKLESATIADGLPEEIADYHARMEIGKGKKCIFLPWWGEFGHQIMHNVRMVHFHEASEKIVCCRGGDKCLYPTADSYMVDWKDPMQDKDRGGSGRREIKWPEILKNFPNHTPVNFGNLSPWQEFNCAIEPAKKIDLSKPKWGYQKSGLKADVVLGIRERQFCPAKNWDVKNWQHIADKIIKAGYTVAVAGKRPYTNDVKGQVVHSGDWAETSASVELLESCKLYIGSDSGISHLASLVGCRMIVFREEGMKYRSYIHRMIETAGHANVTELCNVWSDPEFIVSKALSILSTLTTGDGSTANTSRGISVSGDAEKAKPKTKRSNGRKAGRAMAGSGHSTGENTSVILP